MGSIPLTPKLKAFLYNYVAKSDQLLAEQRTIGAHWHLERKHQLGLHSCIVPTAKHISCAKARRNRMVKVVDSGPFHVVLLCELRQAVMGLTPLSILGI